MNNNMYKNPIEDAVLQDMLKTVAFDDDIMYNYKNYNEKIRRPDLLGKTVKVGASQFSEIYKMATCLGAILEMDLPEIFVYEDFYYGIESRGASQPWIEISAKTIEDFSQDELCFLLARELCAVNLNHHYYHTLIEQTINVLGHGTAVLGVDTLTKYWKITMCRWSRIANYSTDCFGYIASGSLTASISAIKKSVLNNCTLADRMHLLEYLKQTEEINLLNDEIHNFTKLDEMVPYGPFRIKNLIGYAASARGIASIQFVNEMKMKGAVVK